LFIIEISIEQKENKIKKKLMESFPLPLHKIKKNTFAFLSSKPRYQVENVSEKREDKSNTIFENRIRPTIFKGQKTR